MSERTTVVRGSRLGGASSFEDDKETLEFEPRRRHKYVCLLGHETTVPFHADATAPTQWQCGVCPAVARHEDAPAADGGDDGAEAGPVGGSVKRAAKTHWEQLRSRRTVPELEALLDEALSNYRRTGKAF